MKTIEDLGDLRGKRVLVRSDFNVPLDGTTITDDGRIRAALPTLTRLMDAGARVVVTAHLGRPKGAPEDKYSLAPVAARLGELLGKPVALAADVVGESAKATVAALEDGGIALLENIRFDARETSKDEAVRGELADELAALADAFVSDGFGVVHRKQASVYDVALRLPHAAGNLVLAEVSALRKAVEDPERPYVVVLGGSKVSDKLGVIANLLTKADKLLIGGGMVFTFLKAQGHEVGSSLLEEDQVETVKGYLAKAAESGVEIVLPVDIVAADWLRRRRGPRHGRRLGDPRGQDGPGHRPALRRALPRPRSSTREDDRLERPDGRLRVPGLRRAAPARWRRRSSTPTASRSSAAATPPRPCVASASTRRASATSRPAAARASSCSRARSFPASQFWRTETWQRVPRSWRATGR